MKTKDNIKYDLDAITMEEASILILEVGKNKWQTAGDIWENQAIMGRSTRGKNPSAMVSSQIGIDIKKAGTNASFEKSGSKFRLSANGLKKAPDILTKACKKS